MREASWTKANCANTGSDKMAPFADGTAPTHCVLINKIKELFPKDTVKSLAAWLKISLDTARHRIKGDREFSLDEVADLLRSEHGFQILSALMTRAPRPPRWWRVCEPLMDLADAEQLAAAARRRTEAVIRSRQETTDALEMEIRRAEALAIRGSEQARVHLDALRTLGGVVAPAKLRR